MAESQESAHVNFKSCLLTGLGTGDALAAETSSCVELNTIARLSLTKISWPH